MPTAGGFVIGGLTTHLAALGLYTAAVRMINDLAAAIDRCIPHGTPAKPVDNKLKFVVCKVCISFHIYWLDVALQG